MMKKLKRLLCALVFSGAVLWAMDDDLQVSNEEAIDTRKKIKNDEQMCEQQLLEKYIKQGRIFSKDMNQVKKEVKQNVENIENPDLLIARKEQVPLEAHCLFCQKLIAEVVACGPITLKKFARRLDKFVKGPQLRKEQKKLRKARKEDKVWKKVRSMR